MSLGTITHAMTIRLYQRDPYLFEFESKVEERDGDWIRLDGTAFYPGGGGQAKDKGRIHGLDVSDVEERDGHLWHLVPGNQFIVGGMLWCSVDWEKRYDVMKGHTAEHMLFGALQRIEPQLLLDKIDIAPELKRLTVTGPLTWDIVEEAERNVNKAICENLEVQRLEMDREEAEESGVRAKLERIHGDTVDVVEIGDFDSAACAGIHVMETGEIGALLVERMTSAGGASYNLDFVIGDVAVSKSLELSHITLRTADMLGCAVENILRTASNIKKDVEDRSRALSRLSKHVLRNVEPVELNGVKVHAAIVPGIARKELIERAEDIRNEGGIAILISITDQADFVISAAESTGVDCRGIIESCIKPIGGSGGGRKEFVQGGFPNPSKAESALAEILDFLQ